jgi:hypothetical protein
MDSLFRSEWKKQETKTKLEADMERDRYIHHPSKIFG